MMALGLCYESCIILPGVLLRWAKADQKLVGMCLCMLRKERGRGRRSLTVCTRPPHLRQPAALQHPRHSPHHHVSCSSLPVSQSAA